MKRNLSRKVLNSTRKTRNLAALGNAYEQIGNLVNVPLGNLLELNRPPNRPANRLPNNLAGLIPKPFDAALFLDNDSSHVARVASCGPKITTRKVPGTDGVVKVPIRLPAAGGPHVYSNHLQKLSEQGKNAAVVLMKFMLWVAQGDPSKEVEYVDSGSGIGQDDVAYIKNWVNQREGQKLAVLFDYDRTLTVIEGGFYMGGSFEGLQNYLANLQPPPAYTYKSNLASFTIEGFVEYYVGGSERLQMLQELFDFLYQKNVSIYLLTNNRGCSNSRAFFTECMNVLTRGKPSVILCGSDFGMDKRRTIQQQSDLGPGAALKGLCPVVGGKRRRKTKRRQRKQ